jgi:hypothetical protein
MSNASIAPILVDAMSTVSAAAVQPTAQQAARFEQLVQQGDPAAEPAHYGAPLPGLGGDFHEVVDYAGEVSTQLRANLEPAAMQTNLQDLPPELQEALQAQRELNEGIRRMDDATLQFALIGKSVELVENAPKVLYQQG